MVLSKVGFGRLRYLVAAVLLTFHWSMAAEDPVFKSRDHAYRLVTLASGLNQPWGMAFLPGNQGVLITEKVGKVRIYREGLKPRVISGGPNATEFGQGGLLDIAVHPNFTRNGYVFFSYVGSRGLGLGTELARAVFADDEFKDLRILFKAQPKAFLRKVWPRKGRRESEGLPIPMSWVIRLKEYRARLP